MTIIRVFSTLINVFKSREREDYVEKGFRATIRPSYGLTAGGVKQIDRSQVKQSIQWT